MTLIQPAIAGRGSLAGVAYAPYLERLCARRPDVVAAIIERGARAVAESAIGALAVDVDESFEDAMLRMRINKQALHLACAVADLEQTWSLTEVTAALSDFADAALRSSLSATARLMQARGELAPIACDDARGPLPGLILIAMGKLGARELNYSSDVDVTVFFDPATLPVARGHEPQTVAVRIARLLVRAMEEITVEGYVFRTDLRLRPDPGATPIAVSLPSAEIYYQSVGQNWERAAFIKARACAGDMAAGRAFLASLTSFLWRRHLDYAAIADIQSIKRQIRSARGDGELDSAAFDVKLGRGGIRDIELFAQTQQLILGGRDARLRAPTTKGALDALVETGRLDPNERDTLWRAYEFYRGVEHRIQMLADEQTHRVPSNPDDRARVAAMAGYADLAAFDEAIIAARHAVAAIDGRLFADSPSLADAGGSLVFTGVEDDPETLATLAGLGFSDPSHVSGAIRSWHHGRVRAMRSQRARELLTSLTPALLRAVGKTGDADAAFARFSDFFSALPAGVQALSLFAAHPQLLEDVVGVMALAPRLADVLGRRPAMLDAMVEARFAQPLALDEPGARAAAVTAVLGESDGFEAAINAVRRVQREEAFRIDVQVLTGRAHALVAGIANAELAEACVRTLAGVAERETERRFGPPPGRFAVVALGKFGGRELARGSDLDIMVVFDAPEGSGGAEYFARLTQRLITALSAPTEEGGLYEVDMQLRPSGSKGPVAVRLSSFARYYREEAWTWELLALTRLRAVGGDAGLCAAVEAQARAALLQSRDVEKVRADVADMRMRMDRDRPPKSTWDLKLSPGGLVDIEFIAQALQLMAGPNRSEAFATNTGEALDRLARAGLLAPDDHAALEQAWLLYSRLTQWMRIAAHDGAFDPAAIGSALAQRLAASEGRPDVAALAGDLERRQAQVRAVFQRLIGVGDGNAALAR